MSDGQAFWIGLAILLAGPSTSGMVSALKEIAAAMRQANHLKQEELQLRRVGK